VNLPAGPDGGTSSDTHFRANWRQPALFLSGVYRSDGRIETVKYPMLVSLLNESHRQEAEIHALKDRLAQLESKLP